MPERETRLPYMPAIDALRAISVLAVFFYHVGVSWMPGGFLGVDVFFVISGYLITALLVGEFRRGGHINVAAFWLRRARRLLPAVGVMIAVTMLVALVLVPDRIGELRGNAVASLFYVNNWHLIFSHQSYFESFQPSLFRHLWSLSVEEQFYLLWPLVCAGVLARLGRGRLLLVAIAGIVASTLLMAGLYDPASSGGSRAFYGADTRAAPLLAGVALALVWDPLKLPALKGRLALALDVAGVVGLVMVLRAFFDATDFDPGLYHGGFLVLALWASLLVAAVAHPATRLSRLLATGPAIWLGVRSYGFYLWHWPVIALTRPHIDVPLSGPVLIGLQLAATLALADLSYRFVEQPFRRRSGAPSAPSWLRAARPALAAAVIATVAVVGWGGFASSPSGAAATAGSTGPVGGSPNGSAPPVLAIGDSVMRGSTRALINRLGDKIIVDADEARLPYQFPAAVNAYRASGELADDVVIQLGNNGPVYGSDIDKLKAELQGVPHVYLVNVEVPRSWESEVNDELDKAVADWPEATLIDWHAAIDAQPDLTYDGIHPTPDGNLLYAKLVADAIAAAD
jgi:peptidoglycan/LPS O-acetylase OafA/YrhL